MSPASEPIRSVCESEECLQIRLRGNPAHTPCPLRQTLLSDPVRSRHSEPRASASAAKNISSGAFRKVAPGISTGSMTVLEPVAWYVFPTTYGTYMTPAVRRHRHGRRVTARPARRPLYRDDRQLVPTGFLPHSHTGIAASPCQAFRRKKVHSGYAGGRECDCEAF